MAACLRGICCCLRCAEYSFCSPGFEIDSAENLMWGSEMSNNLPSFDFKAITSSLRHQLQLCSSLVNRGIVLVRSASSRNRTSILKEICHSVFHAESVHHSFQVRCTSEDENTLKGIPLHSERAFSETEPGWSCHVTPGQRMPRAPSTPPTTAYCVLVACNATPPQAALTAAC